MPLRRALDVDGVDFDTVDFASVDVDRIKQRQKPNGSAEQSIFLLGNVITSSAGFFNGSTAYGQDNASPC